MAEIVDFGLQQHKIKMDGRFFENTLTVVAGDTARRLEVQLLDTNNMVQDTTGLKLRLNAVVSGKATYTEAVLVDATMGLYYVDLTNGMLLVPGNWQFQWQITDSAGKKLHSFAFTGIVGSNLSEGGAEATNFYLNADELKQMQEDLINGTFDSEVLETNIAEKLNNLETQYAPKLTEVTAQLAKNQQEISKINNKIETTKLKDLQEPFYISHRGGANIFPENTIDAFKGSLALGSNLIEMDVQTLSDGSLGVMHDSTVDRTTNKTGNVADYSAMGFRNLEVNVIPNQGNAKAPLFEDVVSTFGKSAIYAPESKDIKSVKKIVDTLEKHNLKEYAIIQSFEMEELKYAVDKGYACLFLSNSVSPISIKENGIDYVGVSKNVSDSYLQSCLSSGLKIIVYTVNHRYERDKFLNKGVHGFFTDDPFYLEETVKPLTTDPYLNQVFYHGMLKALTNRGDFAEGDRFGFLNTIDSSFPNDGRDFVLQGWSGKLPNTFILEFDYKYIQHITSGWLGIQFCTPNDFYDDFGALTSGYNIILGANNNLDLYRNDNGVATKLDTLLDNGADGQNPVPIKIEVTRDTITITRKDLGLTKTFTDGKYRGGYFHFGRKGSAGTFGNVKIG